MKVTMQDGTIQEVTFEEELGRDAFRHSTSHILAQAVKRLYPNTKLAIGPSIADGFYYDFDTEHRFSEEDFAAIEESDIKSGGYVVYTLEAALWCVLTTNSYKECKSNLKFLNKVII